MKKPDDYLQPQSSPQQAARKLVGMLSEFCDELSEAMDRGESVPLKVMALLTDTKSTAKGIAAGAIRTGQRSIATNLIESVDLLHNSGRDFFACSIVNIIDDALESGIAAENVMFSRGRPR